MTRLATCLRCRTPLTAGNAQAIDPDVCLSCLDAPPDVAPALSRRWLLGLSAAVAALALLPVAAALMARTPKETPREVASASATVETSRDVTPPPAAAEEAAPLTDEREPAGEDDAISHRFNPRVFDRAGAPELDEVERVVKAPQAGPKRVVGERRKQLTEAELASQLASGEEVGLGLSAGVLVRVHFNHVKDLKDYAVNKGVADVTPLRQLRPDLAGLPYRDGPASTLDHKSATELETLSRKLRLYVNALAPAGQDGRRETTDKLGDQLRKDLRGKKPEWLRPEAVPTLNQMMMGEDAAMRRLLVELLTAIPGKRSTVALASRAAFDLSPDVREEAIAALKDRPAEHWRPVLLNALRYPWPAPADFAAEALVSLRDKEAIPELVSLLKLSPASRPYVGSDKRTYVREVVRINHLSNCVLCHPPAVQGNEPVLGVDPVQSVPKGFSVSTTVQNIVPGSHDYGGRGRLNLGNRPVLLRGDITFLRQDFSVALPGLAPAAPGLAPSLVRFDFVVRTRPVGRSERKRWEALEDKSDPQRDSTLFALREMSGRDAGDSTQAWRKAYPTAEAEVRARRLVDAVVRADGLERGTLLARYRDGKGVEYNWALARSMRRLSGASRELARLALVNRLARQDADELRQHLHNADAEVRHAAISACGEKGEMALASDLVALLGGDEAKPATAALKKLTGQDLADATAWRAWLKGE